MATNTPNYNLSVPEDTDKFSDTVQAYRDNLVIIDNNLGGGGGGGGDVAVLGAFVDTDNSTFITINDGSIVYSTYSYTATDDCYVDLLLQGNAGGTIFVKIDGKVIYQHLQTPVFLTDIFLLKKGQVLTLENLQAYSYMTIYGVVQGSKSIVAPIIYSDTEREVGTWRDNKPLYQRSFAVNLTLPYNSWVNTGINIPDGCIVKTEGVVYGVDGITIGILGNIDSLGDLSVLNLRNINAQIDTITVWYTKSTDTAGSGNWNVDGVPTHHYSTSEQVIGTWIDGKPLYECTISVDNPTKLSTSGKYYYDVIYNRSDIEYAQLAFCSVFDSVDGQWFPLPYQRIISSENIDILAQVRADGSFQVTAHFATSAWYNLTKIRYTVQYTKTTDT